MGNKAWLKALNERSQIKRKRLPATGSSFTKRAAPGRIPEEGEADNPKISRWNVVRPSISVGVY